MRRCFAECCWLLLTLFGTACARPQYIADSLQGVKTGPYHIYNCGTRTSEISISLNTLINILQRVIADASQHRSSVAYSTFFKDIAFAPIIHEILSKITTGVPFPPGPHAIRNAPPEYFGSPVTPQFLCVTDYNQMTWSTEAGAVGGQQLDAFKACEQSPVHAYSVFGSKYLNNTIVLCPAFWTYPVIPPTSKSSCLKVDTHFNRFRETGARMVNYQIWVILSELAHSYIYARSGRLIDTLNANECTALIARDAVDSARSFVFYAANVRLGCTDFPRPNGPPRIPHVELMEIGGNTTLSGGSQQSIGNRTIVEDPNAVTLAPWPS